MKFVRLLDNWLNSITMYRLLLYGLLVVAAVAIGFAALGQLSYEPWAMVVSLVLLPILCYGINRGLAPLFRASPNSESSLITGLILFFILPPINTLPLAIGAVIVATVAMAAKYLLAWRGQHIFNPTAIGAVVGSLLGVIHASWWVATPAMLPVTLLLGLLVVRKVRHFQMLTVFVAVSLGLMALLGVVRERDVAEVLTLGFTSWPLVFFGTIMLTEPSTMPPRRNEQLMYAAFIGVIFASQLQLGGLTVTPEIALVLGNAFGFMLSPKRRWTMTLQERKQLSAHVYDFTFTPNRPLRFMPGQYMEWTLPHHHVDGRGNRRTFSVASSPTEQAVHIGIKTYSPSSSFKKAMLALEPGQHISAGQVAGNFVLPDDPRRKLVFVAGGIGITPFRSMLKYLQDTKQTRDIILFYFVGEIQEISYADILHQAQQMGVKIVPVLTTEKPPADWRHPTGFMTKELLEAKAPDYAERTFYLSGPQPMIQHYRDLLVKIGVKRRHIVVDYFSGY